jgi:hypothetical protein
MDKDIIWGKETVEGTTQTTEGFMCATDFVYELGCACGGNVIYPSIEDLKENRECW